MQPNSIQVVFSHEERDTLIQLLDLATKAGGLQVAHYALKFVQMLQDQPVPAPAVEPEVVRLSPGVPYDGR